MLAKNLTFLAKADSAGIVLGARVPIILTSRADSLRARHGIVRSRGALRRCAPPRANLSAQRERHGYDSRRQRRIVERQVPGLCLTGEAGLQRRSRGRWMESAAGRNCGRWTVRPPCWSIASMGSRPFRTSPRRLPLRERGCATSCTSSRVPSATASCTVVPSSIARCASIRTILSRLERYTNLAPLHQPFNLAPIRSLLSNAPEVLQVACFDTAFHRSHGDLADHYAIPCSSIRRRPSLWLPRALVRIHRSGIAEGGAGDRAQAGDRRASRQRCVDVRASSRPQRRKHAWASPHSTDWRWAPGPGRSIPVSFCIS